MTKILIVEDEPKAGDYLKQGLREAGYAIDLVINGVDGLHLGLEGDHDLVILDVMLPGLNGRASRVSLPPPSIIRRMQLARPSRTRCTVPSTWRAWNWWPVPGSCG